VIQRAGDGLRLNPHPHALVLDGVYLEPTSPAEPPVFRALPGPTKTEVAQVAWEVCQRVTRLLKKRGVYLDAGTEGAPAEDDLAQQQPLLAAFLLGFAARHHRHR